MQHANRASLARLALAAGFISLLGGCPAGGVPGGPGGVGGKGSGSVDPNTCGNYAASDAGRKLKAFLEATVQLEAEVKDTENYLRDTCAMMGRELGLAGDQLEGDTRAVCNAVSAGIRDNLQVGIKGGARLKIDYQPAVCTVNVEAAASATAQCEARAEADVAVKCEGSCQGTCQGRCDGTCAGKAGTGGSGGECNGECRGTCEGSCSGGCEGHADVQADASCEARAEVAANAEAKCTEPEVTVTYDAAVVVDKSKVEAVAAAIKKGMPRILMIQAKMSGPVKAAFQTWARAAKELRDAGPKLVNSFGEQAMCISGQIAAAAGLLASIQVSVEVQVEVSAEVQGSASGGAG